MACAGCRSDVFCRTKVSAAQYGPHSCLNDRSGTSTPLPRG
jgi:hypothetical protein